MGICTHFERCVCQMFDKVFTVHTAALYGSHCRVCKTGGSLTRNVPMDKDTRIEEQCGHLAWTLCNHCGSGAWTYVDHALEYCDEFLLCTDSIWDRRDDPEKRTFVDHKLVFTKEPA